MEIRASNIKRKGSTHNGHNFQAGLQDLYRLEKKKNQRAHYLNDLSTGT